MIETLQTIGPISITAKSGKIPTVEILAYTGGAMRCGRPYPIVVDLASLKLSKTVPLLLDHQTSVANIIAAVVPAVSNGKLTATGNLAVDSPAAQQVMALAKAGVELEASVGCEIPTEHTRILRAGESVNVNNQKITAGAEGLAVYSNGELMEISLVVRGACRDTAVAVAASHEQGRIMEIETITSTADTLTADSGKDAMTAERKRVSEIHTAASKYTRDISARDKIVAQAVTDGWDLNKAELEMLRADRSQAPGIGSGHSGRVNSVDVIQAAACLKAGLPEKFVAAQIPEQMREQAMNAATSQAKDMSISSIMRMVLRAAGKPADFSHITNEVIRTTFECGYQLKAAGFSTYSLPGFLSNVQNKAMLQAYTAAAVTWPLISARANVKDFRPYRRFRLIGSGEFKTIPNGGEIEHVSLTEQDYGGQLATEGAMLVTTRQDLINDDLGALAEKPRILGRMAGVKIEEEVYTLILSNPGTPAFFSTDNGNLRSGVTVGTNDSRLNIEGLTRAEQVFLEMTDGNGKPAMVQPSILLVPPALKTTARALINSTELQNVGDDSPTGNPFAGAFKPPISSAWLMAGLLTGGSNTAWYLLADPAGGVAAVEVGFLNGVENPTIETAEADFNTLGVATRAYLDFGVALQDPRGAVKSTGAE